MNRDVKLTLISSEPNGSDEYGRAKETRTRREIYAVACGVKRNEFYQAQALGMTPTATFRCFEFEYRGEQHVQCGGKDYRIIRTYPLEGERLELVCTDIAEG